MSVLYMNKRHTLQQILDIRQDPQIYNNYFRNISGSLYIGCIELYDIFGKKGKVVKSQGLDETIDKCKKYIKDPNIEPMLNKYLTDIIEHFETDRHRYDQQSYNYLCNYFLHFYQKYMLYSDISINYFLEIFKYENHFKKVNNYMLLKDLKNRLPEIFKYADVEVHEFDKFAEFYKVLNKKDSDYYPGTYSDKYNEKNNITHKDFKGLPTRISYGLMIQWNKLNDWEGKNIKKHYVSNKEKFEYFIRNEEKQKYLNNLSNKLNCETYDIIKLFEKICNVDNIEIDEPIRYLLRSFYLWLFLENKEANIRTNSKGYTFKKKVSVENYETGKYKKTETDGTFLSEVYDAYNKANYDYKKKIKQDQKTIKKRKYTKRPSSPKGITNTLSNKFSNSNIQSTTNNKSSNSGINISNNKFSFKSLNYNTQFPNTLSKKLTSKK